MAEENDAVGYGKPPKHTRFRKGQSGNPKGRPKKNHTNMNELIKKELRASVTIREGGETKTVTKGQAIAKALVNGAINGKPTALRYLQQRIPEEALAEAAEQDAKKLEETRERILGRIDDYIERDEKEREGHRNELRQHGVSEDDIDALVGMDDEGKEERRQKVAQECKERGVPAGLIKRVLDSRLK